MMLLRKWNPAIREYKPYEVPDEWHVSCYENDMATIVNCAQCGQELPFGECYTSRQVHTEHGFGYGVCGGCYAQEWEEEREAQEVR